jgi:hypothetical protein
MKNEQAVPHHIRVQHYAQMMDRATTEVVLEAARGPVGGPKLTVERGLWDRIKALSLPWYELEDDRSVLPVCEAARFVTRLKENEAKTAKWPAKDKEVFRDVLSLLWQNQGLVIARR